MKKPIVLSARSKTTDIFKTKLADLFTHQDRFSQAISAIENDFDEEHDTLLSQKIVDGLDGIRNNPAELALARVVGDAETWDQESGDYFYRFGQANDLDDEVPLMAALRERSRSDAAPLPRGFRDWVEAHQGAIRNLMAILIDKTNQSEKIEAYHSRLSHLASTDQAFLSHNKRVATIYAKYELDLDALSIKDR